MENVSKDKVIASLTNLKDKKSKIYFFVQDTKGNAKASVRYIYQIALELKKSNFNPVILHEKNDYMGVDKWLDSEFMTIPHQSIENQNLQIAPEDFLVIPELFAFVMEQVKNLPCAKIVLTQSYAYMLETLQPGQSWSQHGVYKCITTCSTQKEYIEKVMRQASVDILEPVISESFTKKGIPPMPIIGVHTREQEDAISIIKTFYLRFPQYRWFTFRDLRGLSEKEFGKTLKDCFLSVWVDTKSGFGTFPLESMACGVPVLGKIPDLQPSWMTQENGVWITDLTLITDFIADFIQNWLEDNIKPELYENMDKTVEQFKNSQKFSTDVTSLFENYLTTRANQLEEQISKL